MVLLKQLLATALTSVVRKYKKSNCLNCTIVKRINTSLIKYCSLWNTVLSLLCLRIEIQLSST